MCGTSSDPITSPDGTVWQWGTDTWVAGTGGTTHPGPGMSMHVSCSQNFIAQDGWDAGSDNGNGPQQGIDTDWHLIQTSVPVIRSPKDKVKTPYH